MESARKLAAIMFTDIAGYTALMQRDESLAVNAVKKHQRVLETGVPAHGGEIYQFYGDGSLSIFGSATKAVQCALKSQQIFLEEPSIPVRIGIHIGEILYDSGKIFGDGVNLASRIESIGVPGAILISRHVYEKIRNHKQFDTQSLGIFEFKNVDDPLEVFALANPGLSIPDPELISGKLKDLEAEKSYAGTKRLLLTLGILILIVLSGAFLFSRIGQVRDFHRDIKKSIAVLPFTSLDPNSQDDFFGLGIAEDIITQLVKIQDLKVTSKASSMKYGESNKEISKIADELGVSHVLQGSVRKTDYLVRVSVQLVDAKSNSYLWSVNYDREMKDILNVQQEIALAIADAMEVTLNDNVKDRLEEIRPIDPEAYSKYLKGQQIVKNNSGTLEELENAVEYFEQAIEVEPNFVYSYIGLTELYLDFLFWYRATNAEIIPKAREIALKALSIDPSLGECYAVLGAIDLYTRNVEDAESNLKKAIELSPSYSFAYERLAWVYFFQDREDDFFPLMEHALQLDPLSTRYMGGCGYAYYLERRFASGIKRMKEFLELFPEDNFLLWNLANLYTGSGEYDLAIEMLKRRSIGTHTNWILGYTFGISGRVEEAKENLDYHLERSKNDFVPNHIIATIYLGLDEKEKAIEFLQKGLEEGGVALLVWGISKDKKFDPIRNDPRFIEIAKQASL